jgi:hypothetical protein
MVTDWISALSDAITATAAASAAVIAFRGVSTWRDELHGRTQYDLARRILVASMRSGMASPTSAARL